MDFPVKTYGDYTFPAGKYRALQITLGKGEGHNWWCVLYPNMCFQGSVYEVMDESSGEELREVLTQEEYADVFDSGKCRSGGNSLIISVKLVMIMKHANVR